MTLSRQHKDEHRLIASAIAEDWLARDRLLVHIARHHNYQVKDVLNIGLADLVVGHDDAHGEYPLFAEAERKCPDEGLRRGLSQIREGVG